MQQIGSRPVSMNTAVAASLDGDRVAIYASKPFRMTVLGEPVTLESGEEIPLPAGGVVARDERYVRLTTPCGFVLEVRPGERSLSLRLGLPANAKSVGLLGNLDGMVENDLSLAQGECADPARRV